MSIEEFMKLNIQLFADLDNGEDDDEEISSDPEPEPLPEPEENDSSTDDFGSVDSNEDSGLASSVANLISLLSKLKAILPLILGGIFLLFIIFLIFFIIINFASSNKRKKDSFSEYNCDYIKITGTYAGDYELEDYIAGVVTAELRGGGEEAMKAMAVTARSMALYLTDECTRPINNDEGKMLYVPPTEEAINATELTKGLILTDISGELIPGYYSAYPREGYADFPSYPACGSITCNSTTCTTTLYRMPTGEPFQFTMDKYKSNGYTWNGLELDNQKGHCYGFNEVGAMYLEEVLGYGYEDILEVFFDTTVSSMFGASGVGIVPWSDDIEYYDCAKVVWGSRGASPNEQFYSWYLGNMHKAWDIHSNPRPNYIYSIGPGVVEVAKYTAGGYGWHVIVRTENALLGEVYIVYGHFAYLNPNIKVGTVLKADDWLGLEGTTGLSTGVHLHFETRRTLDYKTKIKPDEEAGYTFEDVKKVYCKRK